MLEFQQDKNGGKMNAKVIKIPFKLRGKKRKLNEEINDVTKYELALFPGYLKQINTKQKEKKKEDIDV